MHFNPVRFEEFLSFAITVCGTWVGASWLVGGYKSTATSGMPFLTCLPFLSHRSLNGTPCSSCEFGLLEPSLQGLHCTVAHGTCDNLVLAQLTNLALFAAFVCLQDSVLQPSLHARWIVACCIRVHLMQSIIM